MKNLIQHLLHEAIKNIPYDPQPEIKAVSGASSLSNPSFKLNLNKIKFRISKAAEIANEFKQSHPNDNYYLSPTDGDGFYQVEFRHDGQIKTKHIKASSDMEQRGGSFQPSDIGTCKTFQNIARYCFVKAGRNNTSIGISPADDAANKALVIFKSEILDFLDSGSYDDGKAPEISKEKMTDKEAKHKEKKDLETKIDRRISDSEWLHYQQTGHEPKPKAGLTMDPTAASEFEKKQAIVKARIDAAKARMKSN